MSLWPHFLAHLYNTAHKYQIEINKEKVLVTQEP